MENKVLDNLFEGIQVTSLEDMVAINLVKQWYYVKKKDS